MITAIITYVTLLVQFRDQHQPNNAQMVNNTSN